MSETDGRYRAQTASGAIAQGPGSTAVGAGGVYIGGNVSGDVYAGPAVEDTAEALRVYRRVLMQANSHLPLRGMAVTGSDATGAQAPIGLTNVYVDLNTTKQVTTSVATLVAEMRPLSVLEAVIDNRALVLLGDPGSGKSTFVHYLAYCLAANALASEENDPCPLPEWPDAEADLLPIVVTLRDFAAVQPGAAPVRDTPRYLWEFITDRLTQQNLAFAAKPMHHVLENGRALVLLDGLDEVSSADRRTFVRDAVSAFVDRYPQNRYLITCRVSSYQPPTTSADADWRLPPDRFPAYELAPFDEERIERFIRAWYAELARLGSVQTEQAEGLSRRLQVAVRRPDLRSLASNPLLLTVMALVHTHQGRLPEVRALLYEDTVDLLLWRWEQVKSTENDGGGLQLLLAEAERDEVDLKGVLGELAFAAQIQADDGLADIGELKLYKTLATLNDGDLGWAQRMVAVMKLRAGLLVERRPEVFTFPHRTFQEYLAGTHLAGLPDFGKEAAVLANKMATDWRQVILLAVGHLVYVRRNMDKPLVLVAELCPASERVDDANKHNLWLAGDVLLEMGRRRVQDTKLGRDLLHRVRQRLAHLVAGDSFTPRERAQAGDTLGRLGDPRPGVGVRTVENGRVVPDMVFCYVPPGPFWMGSGEDDPLAKADETPQHQVDIPYGYWIGQYPVTVAQFRSFIERSSHQLQSEEGLQRPVNRPIDHVTWEEAVAFCRWLTEVGQENDQLPPGWAARLPSEAEWEKAARGGTHIPLRPTVWRLNDSLPTPTETVVKLVENPYPKRRYPWGDTTTIWTIANYEKSGIETSTAVGAFPAGATPYGALDFSGNVAEWTRSQQRPYPYEASDGREEMEGRTFRVVRGGAFWSDGGAIRCAARYGNLPTHLRHYGFRIVLAPTGKEPAEEE